MATIGSGPGRVRGRHRRLAAVAVSLLAAVSLVAGVLTAVGVLGGGGSPPSSFSGNPVAVHRVPGRPVKVPPMPVSHHKPAAWPAAGSGTAAFAAARPGSPAGEASRMPAGPTAGSVRAGSLPVWVGEPAGSGSVLPVRTARSARKPGKASEVRSAAQVIPPHSDQANLAALASASPVSRVAVSMTSQAAAARLGVRGVVFSVARADGSAGPGRVHVSVDYGSFADAYGGSYASRLHLVELSACALTTPQVPSCRKQVTVVSANDVRTFRVGADVILPGIATSASSRRGTGTDTAVLTAKTAAASPGLVLAVTASSYGPAGNFGAEPLSEENQWVSGGSSGAYTYSYPITVPPVPGGLQPSVALDYSSQAADGLNASTNNQASWIGDGWTYEPGFIENDNPTCATQPLDPPTLDLCAGATEQTITLNGTTTPLVVSSGGTTHPEADGGQQVIQVASTAQNPFGGYEVIEPDGTQYWFGVNELPGWASGDPVTNSVWTVPVSNGGRLSPQAWRYMLDYVVDAKGDAIAYFYNTQTNYYAESGGTTGTGQYTQGGVLAKIEYGLRAGNIYSQTPAAQVTFTPATSRQDAPDDLACAQGAACPVTAPTFWTDDALTGISTQALVNGALRTVDTWALADTYPATGDTTTSPSLWLSSITRTGQDGTTPVTLPPVSFAGTAMPNLAAGSPGAAQGNPLITRYRLTSITNQYGGMTTVKYSPADAACAAGTFPKEYANTGLCYPAYWWTNPLTGTYQQDWFNLYDTKSVTDTDTTGGDPPVVTAYTDTGPAWHYDNDTMSRSANWTWDQWRGFRTVTTQVGTSPDPVTQTVDTYLQGMSDDESDDRFSGGVINNGQVFVTSSHGDKQEDLNQDAGMKFEQIVYNGAGSGSPVTDTIWFPYSSSATGTNSTLHQGSFITSTSSTATYTTLAGGGSRESTITYTYDAGGQVLTEADVPDTTDSSQATCTSTTYKPVGTISSLPSQVEVWAGTACSSTKPSAVVSDTLYSYDPAGNTTKVQKAVSVTSNGLGLGLTYTYADQGAATYDQYGRVLTSTDADNRTTTTAYTPATGAEPASVQVTDPAGLATTTTYDPARDLATGVTDPAGYQTAETYDALGRQTASWTAGNPSSGPAVDTYSYTVSNTAPPVTTEQAEQPSGGYLTTDTIGDSFGQTRETQAQTASGGTDVSDISYNSDGWKALTSDPYYVTGAPTGTLVTAAPTSVPSQTGYVYDGDGRVIKQVAYKLGTGTWETGTTYGGSYVTVVPPSGGTSQTTFTDGRGLTSAIYQYHAGVPASPSDPAADYDKTSYSYTAAKKLATITDAANNTWSYTYDLLGNQLTQTDPDAGKSASSYDNAGQLMSVTDARNKTISWTYDADGRKTAEYDTTGGALQSTASQLASWTYDTLAKGKLTSSTAFSGGASYTEAVTGYNSYGLASGDQTVIPSAQGALAGTYSATYSYAPTGQLTSYTDSAAGGLPAETITTGYDSAGRPTSLTGASSYVGSLSYTSLGQPLQYTMGSSSEPAYITDTWDAQTGRLTEQNTQTGTTQTSVDDLHYSYDPSGNIAAEADTPSADGVSADVQCFSYDYLARLVQAWAQASTGCATTPSASAEGGAAPYWDTYGYNTTGSLTKITATTPAGTVNTTTFTYPAAGAAQPHALTGQAVTTPSGTANTSYGYDPGGNLATITAPAQSQALTWNDAGQLAQDTTTPKTGTAASTSYIYDADGTLLLTQDPGTTTLYLPDEEFSLTGSTVTGTRYYTIGGTTIATRTGASSLAYLAGDQHGTSTVAIDSATLNVTRRYYDPYGNPRGTPPASFPTGQKGFIGGATDTATGLTDLGARQYQPATGSFISPDPLLNPDDPQNLNPYAYAHSNPATDSDPTGATCNGSPDNPQCYGNGRTCTENPSICQKNNDPPPRQQARNSTTTPSSNCPVVARNCSHRDPLTHPAHDHHKPAKHGPVTKGHTTGDPTCLPVSMHVGMCVKANQNINLNDLLNLLGNVAALGCSITDEEESSICTKLGDEDPGLPQIPQEAEDVLGYIESHNGSPPPGYKGGSVYHNSNGLLPRADSSGARISYKEYDIRPKIKGVDRTGERLVIGSDGSVYFTNSHYTHFIEIR
jgi:RHS repeat-associated protein